MFARIVKYICDIGTATENLGRAGLFLLLFKEIREFISDSGGGFDQFRAYEQAKGMPPDMAVISAWEKLKALRDYVESTKIRDLEEAALKFAVAVTNSVFGEVDDRDFVVAYSVALHYDDALCSTLTAAAYNGCYARYLLGGGKVGPFSNPFLDYVRALSGLKVADRKWRIALLQSLSNAASGPEILGPLDAMSAAIIFRPLPANPNERRLYEAVLKFATDAGVPIK